MSRTKFEAARELIQEKHYDAARAVLCTIDHEKARDWLAKLDAIDPPRNPERDYEVMHFPPVPDVVEPTPKRDESGNLGIAAFAFLMAVAVIVSYFALPWAKDAQLTAHDAYQLARAFSVFSSESGAMADVNLMILIPLAAAWAGITAFLGLIRAVSNTKVLWGLSAIVCVAGFYPYARLLLFNGQALSKTIPNLGSGASLGMAAMVALFCCAMAGTARETR